MPLATHAGRPMGDPGSPHSVEYLRPGVVSVVAPCFNVERYIDAFIDSLVAQTYKQLEVVFVNDGSTDATRVRILARIPDLERQGYRCVLVDQENAGLAGAINGGLRVFSGEFLTWPDPDDWLSDDSIEKRVALLRAHPEVAMVRGNGAIYSEAEQRVTGHFLEPGERASLRRGLVADLLFARTFFLSFGALVRSSCFLEVNPGRSIYARRDSSQNLQMLVPVADAFPVIEYCGVAGTYRVRGDSRSKQTGTAEKIIKRTGMLLDIVEHVAPALRSYTEDGMSRVRAAWLRNKLYPQYFRRGDESLIRGSLHAVRLSAMRRLLAERLLSLRSSGWGRRLDAASRGIYGRVLARIFDRAVHMGAAECIWPGEGNSPDRAGST